MTAVHETLVIGSISYPNCLRHVRHFVCARTLSFRPEQRFTKSTNSNSFTHPGISTEKWSRLVPCCDSLVPVRSQVQLASAYHQFPALQTNDPTPRDPKRNFQCQLPAAPRTSNGRTTLGRAVIVRSHQTLPSRVAMVQRYCARPRCSLPARLARVTFVSR
jgi:hypothetical protein